MLINQSEFLNPEQCEAPSSESFHICKQCGQPKPLSAFGPCADNRNGHSTKCRKCQAANQQAWRIKRFGKGRNHQVWELRAQGLKRCPKCGQTRPITDFYISTHNNDGRYYRCPDCHRLNKYNLSEEELQWFLAMQRGKCASCLEPFTMGTNGKLKFVIDHDHACCPKSKESCGKCIKGLLCSKCNTGIGQFDDNADTLISAARYVQQTRTNVIIQ